MPQATSFDSVNIISPRREHLLTRLGEIAARIRRERREGGPVRVLGSLARGDATDTSDAGVLIVLREQTEAEPHRRILTFLPNFDRDRGPDLLVHPRAELEQRSVDNVCLQRVWRESMPL